LRPKRRAAFWAALFVLYLIASWAFSFFRPFSLVSFYRDRYDMA
jgi:hypothetical protein